MEEVRDLTIETAEILHFVQSFYTSEIEELGDFTFCTEFFGRLRWLNYEISPSVESFRTLEMEEMSDFTFCRVFSDT